MAKEEIKASLLANLEGLLDPYMRDNAFARHKTSLIYTRKLHGSTQKIHLPIQIHPSDNPHAAAALYPQMEVFLPAVDRVRDAMIGDDLGLLEGVTGRTSHQPIGFTAEKAHPGRWYIFQTDSVADVVSEMKAFIERWTMPFLDGYATPDDMLEADRKNDGRMIRDRAQIVRVVAAALVCNQKGYALELMGKWLGAPGLRKRYERVYKFIEQTV